jgi:hypothetical protein
LPTLPLSSQGYGYICHFHYFVSLFSSILFKVNAHHILNWIQLTRPSPLATIHKDYIIPECILNYAS